jgi:hypothetical protein
MPIHDWTRVDAGIFHRFHHFWISAIACALNQRLLPGEYFALAERQGAGVAPVEPQVTTGAETDLEFDRRKQNVVAVRHASGDHLVAIVEVVSKGNKSGRKAFDDFIRKAAEFLEHRVQLRFAVRRRSSQIEGFCRNAVTVSRAAPASAPMIAPTQPSKRETPLQSE